MACMEPATDLQVSICSDVITTDTEGENDVEARYAHGLAAVLSSACFVTFKKIFERNIFNIWYQETKV